MQRQSAENNAKPTQPILFSLKMSIFKAFFCFSINTKLRAVNIFT